MKRFLLRSGAVLLVIIVLGLLKFGSALYQEGNPIPILYSIAKLEIKDQQFEIYEETDDIEYYVALNHKEEEKLIVKVLLLAAGWKLKDQMGSALTYEKDDRTLVVETRLFTKDYILFSLPKQYKE